MGTLENEKRTLKFWEREFPGTLWLYSYKEHWTHTIKISSYMTGPMTHLVAKLGVIFFLKHVRLWTKELYMIYKVDIRGLMTHWPAKWGVIPCKIVGGLVNQWPSCSRPVLYQWISLYIGKSCKGTCTTILHFKRIVMYNILTEKSNSPGSIFLL